MVQRAGRGLVCAAIVLADWLFAPSWSRLSVALALTWTLAFGAAAGAALFAWARAQGAL